jgi:putative FmdB family regulatory protein
MPLYEYVCLDCGNHFDALRSMRDSDKPITCNKCESDHTSRQISVFFANSGGKVVAGGGGGGCGGCSGGSCASCGGH